MIKEYYCNCGWYKEFGVAEKMPLNCPECGGVSCRIVYGTKSKVKSNFCNVDGLMKENVRYSYSLGINPDDKKQVAAFHKRHPGAEFRKDTGQMVIHNRSEKLKRMKEAGVEEYG